MRYLLSTSLLVVGTVLIAVALSALLFNYWTSRAWPNRLNTIEHRFDVRPEGKTRIEFSAIGGAAYEITIYVGLDGRYEDENRSGKLLSVAIELEAIGANGESLGRFQST